jgi:hypothetical protein
VLTSYIHAVLDNQYVRVGGLPLGAVLLTAACRRGSACRYEVASHNILSWDTVDVGIDLLALAILTAFTSALEASARVATLDDLVASSSVSSSDIAKQLSQANDRLVAAAWMALLGALATLFVVLWVADKGYHVTRAVRERRERMSTPAVRTRKGVLVGLVSGVVMFGLVLATVAPD